jgi:hypothetical protein
MIYDPIDWDELKHGLLEWGQSSHVAVDVPKETEKLFRERTPLGHPARIGVSKGRSFSPYIYHFFDPECPCVPETDHLLSCGIPLDSAQRISKINNHPKGLSLLGILPNQLRGLLKSGGQDADIAFDDISMELFRHGYRIWIQRKRLNKNFWKNIAPNEWKKSYKEPGRTTRKKLEQKILSDKCRNPFHFLARHKNLSKIPPTPCRCFSLTTPIHPQFVDISSFTHRNLLTSDMSLHITREDKIRGAHDREKISKYK